MNHKKQLSHEIYYCVSNDINITNNNDAQSIWQLSVIKLPFAMYGCQCVITNKKGNKPKLIILGGYNEDFAKTNACFEYNLCDIIEHDRFIHFIIDDKRV